MKTMTHNQYVHNLIQKMNAQKSPEMAQAATPRKNKRTLSAKSGTEARSEGLQMKALSVRQPMAGLIIAGIKNVENRSWITYFTGQLVIVSTAKPDAREWWEPAREKCKRLGYQFPEDLCAINGSALGIVDLNYLLWTNEDGSAFTDHQTLKIETVQDWWDQEMIGFYLENPRRLPTPIPVTGRLGLYNLPAEVEALIKKQLQ